MMQSKRAFQIMVVAMICLLCTQGAQSEIEQSMIKRLDSIVVKDKESRTIQIEQLFVKNGVVVKRGGVLNIIGTQCVIGGEIKVEEGGVLAIKESYIGGDCQLKLSGRVNFDSVMWFRTPDKHPPVIELSGKAYLKIERSDISGSVSRPTIMGHCDVLLVSDCQISTGNCAAFIDVSASKFEMTTNRLVVSGVLCKERGDGSAVKVIKVEADNVHISKNVVVIEAVCKSVYDIVTSQECIVEGEKIRMLVTGDKQVNSVVLCRGNAVKAIGNTIYGSGYLTFVEIHDSGSVSVNGNRAFGASDVLSIISVDANVCAVNDNLVLGADKCSWIMYLRAKSLEVTGNEVRECVVESVYWIASGLDVFRGNIVYDCQGPRVPYRINNPYINRRNKVMAKDRQAWDFLIVENQDTDREYNIAGNMVEKCMTMRVCLFVGNWDADKCIQQVAGWRFFGNVIDVVVEVDEEWTSDVADRSMDVVRVGNTVGRFVGKSRGMRLPFYE